jgi:hypothetical protein
MTRLVRVPLGMAPGVGKVAADQCIAMKRQMRAVLPSVDGAWMVTVEGEGGRGIEVVYDEHTVGAEEWAGKAREMAEGIWKGIGERRRERVR